MTKVASLSENGILKRLNSTTSLYLMSLRYNVDSQNISEKVSAINKLRESVYFWNHGDSIVFDN